MITNKSSDFFKFTTTRPVAILMVVIGISVFGWISYQQLPLNLMPDITYPSLTVRTEYLGTAPEEVETTISRPLEQELGVVDNLVSINSISKAGQSDLILEFSWDTDMNKATSDLREKIDQVWLPEEVKRPIILRYDPSLDPIMRLGMYGERSLFYMRYLAEEDIKRRLETLDGVAAVKVKGGLEEEIRVELNEQQLTLIGINIQQVKNRLAQENINLAGGNLKEGQTEYLVRTLNEFKTVSEIGEVVVGNWNGKEIRINDIATVNRTNKEREIVTRINGQESVEIEIYKEADANIVAVAKIVSDAIFGTAEQQAFVKRMEARKKAIKQKAEEAKKDTTTTKIQPKPEKQRGDDFIIKQMTNFVAYNLPEGVKIDKLSDQSVFIENAVNEVKQTAILGGVLAIIILFVFLRNLVVTLIVGVSIPISIISTFAPMKIFGVSLNIMSLGGLALGIGMLVDNSIVVLESISRCREEGDNLIQATIRGVGEVGGAVFASTLTTIAVFFPIVFVEGVAGQIFGDLSLTVVFSLLASLAIALFLIPMLSSRETSKFVSGAQLTNILKQSILRFDSDPKVNELTTGSIDSKNTGSQKFTSGILELFKILLHTLLKILKLFSGLVLSLFKFITLTIPIVFPLLIIASVVKWILILLSKLIKTINAPQVKFGEKILHYAENPDFWFLTYAKEIWPQYLISWSYPAFYADLQKIRNRFQGKLVVKRIGLFITSIFSFIFYFIKYIFLVFMESLFRIVHFVFLFVAILFKSITLIFKLIFHAPVKLLFTAFNWSYGKLEDTYPKLLGWSLNNRGMVIGSMAVLFIFSLLVLGPQIGSELIPEVHQGEFNLELTLPVGSPAEQTDERVLPIQEFISGQQGVAKVASVIGVDKSESTNTDEGEHTAKLTVTIKRASSVIGTEEQLIKSIREHMSDYSGIQSKISRPTLFSFKTPVEVEIYGFNLEDQQRIAEQAEAEMKKIPGLQDVKANIQRGNPEVQIIYNRKILSRYNLNILDVASIVRNKVRGDVATEFKEEDRRIDILVRVREEDKESIDNLRRLVINPGSSVPLPLEAVADIKVNEGPSEIRRIDQQRAAVITANIFGRDLRSVSVDIYNMLSSMDMPDDFTFELAGQNKEMETSLNSLMLALGLAIFLVYIVMASQFESLLHPFIIIFTIPLALIGVLIFLYILQIPASVVVFLGVIMLAGIVVNNAIVLVDYINQLRARGIEKIEAIMTAGKVRLRPIMMTTSTTVLGLLPMAIGMGDGAEIRTPMAITVIVGLITSTILTLVVIPTVYAVLDRKN
ncbi:efflux RND transporter permease subunit [Calditrichota bacterium]